MATAKQASRRRARRLKQRHGRGQANAQVAVFVVALALAAGQVHVGQLRRPAHPAPVHRLLNTQAPGIALGHIGQCGVVAAHAGANVTPHELDQATLPGVVPAHSGHGAVRTKRRTLPAGGIGFALRVLVIDVGATRTPCRKRARIGVAAHLAMGIGVFHKPAVAAVRRPGLQPAQGEHLVRHGQAQARAGRVLAHGLGVKSAAQTQRAAAQTQVKPGQAVTRILGLFSRSIGVGSFAHQTVDVGLESAGTTHAAAL